jgi:hypothetical protein
MKPDRRGATACCARGRESQASAARPNSAMNERRNSITSSARASSVGAPRCQERRGNQPFSSRLSWLKKRQSVPSAMILLGVDLIMPTSRSRSE